MNNIEISILFLSVFLSFSFLYLIDNFGIHLKIQLLFPLFSIVSAVIFIFINPTNYHFYLDIGFLTTPMVVFIMYNILNKLSLYFHKKELRFTYSYATHRKHKYLYGEDDKYKITDYIFSFILILFIMLWAPFFAAVMVK